MLVVISIICVLSSFLYPTYQKINSTSKDLNCRNNLKTIYLAKDLYQDNNDQFFPNDYYVESEDDIDNKTGYSWHWLLLDGNYIDKNSLSFFTCPSDDNPSDFKWHDKWNKPTDPMLETQEILIKSNGSSYMAHRYSMKVTEYHGVGIKEIDLIDPTNYNYLIDGHMVSTPSWMNLKHAPFNSNIWDIRVRWDHDGNVNFLKGDGHIQGVLRYDHQGLKALSNSPWYNVPIKYYRYHLDENLWRIHDNNNTTQLIGFKKRHVLKD